MPRCPEGCYGGLRAYQSREATWASGEAGDPEEDAVPEDHRGMRLYFAMPGNIIEGS